ncbi:MAG TPA: TPM domain-containing protein [Pyrinomonadaceae bacterium]
MRTTRIRLAVVISLLFAGAAADAQVAQPTPLPGTYVHDFAGVIADEREAEIQAKARRLKDEHRTEIAVVTIDSLQGEESFAYSMRMARSWGIGSPEGDVRGLLILVAVKDRKTAFRTSRHVEGELPDGVTGEISRAMNAYFKQGDFGGGLSAGMDKIIARLKEVGEPQPIAAQQQSPPARGSGIGWLWLPAVIVVPAFGLGYAALRRRGKKRRETAAAAARSPSGFRAWASKVDPTPVPKTKYKSQDVTRAGSRPAKDKKKKSATRSSYQAPSYYESSGASSSSSSYDSSSSSYDSSSSSSDSGSSYSGGSDFGGGGSDSSW